MKDTCKQAFFRRKNPGQQRGIEDPLGAGDQEERELEFFNIVPDRRPTNESHAISCEDTTGTLINITLELKGETSYFPSRKLTKHEFYNCPRIELTYLTPKWDPHLTTFQEQKEALVDNKGKLDEWSSKEKNVDRYISIFDTMLASTLIEYQDDPTHNLSPALDGKAQVSGIVSGVNTKKGKAEVTPYDLAKRWNIGLDTAKKTLLKTTQRGLRTSPNSLLSQWYSTNDRMLRYRRLPVDMFIDTLEAGLFYTGEINMPKFMPTGTHGVKHTQWQRRVMHMRHCHSCLHRRGSQALGYWMEQENRLWVNSGIG